MIKTLTAFFKSWNNDFLDDDYYLENVDLDAVNADLDEEKDLRKLYVDFADYDHFPKKQDLEKSKAKKKILNCILPSKDDLIDVQNE